MGNLRKIIKEEIDDFDWVRDVQVNTDLTPAQVYHRYGDITFDISGQYIANQFNDLALEGDKIYLYASGWEDFVDLFEDCSGGYNNICRGLAKHVLSEDDYWEPYYDVIGDWESEVWSIVESEPELLNHVVEHLRKDYVGNTEVEYDDEEITLSDELLDELVKTNRSALGQIINESDDLEELKRDLSWSYEAGYNDSARSSVWESAYGAIKDLLGEGHHITINYPNGRNISKIKFNVTDLVIDSIRESVGQCFYDCNRYWDEERHYDPIDTEFDSLEEAYEDYCDCNDKPFEDYSYFLDFLANHLYETSEQLNPRYDEYPDSDDIAEYMKEDIYGRF